MNDFTVEYHKANSTTTIWYIAPNNCLLIYFIHFAKISDLPTNDLDLWLTTLTMIIVQKCVISNSMISFKFFGHEAIFLWKGPLNLSFYKGPPYIWRYYILITLFNSWECDMAKLAQCQECDKLHITLSEKNFWKNFQKCLFWPKKSKNMKKKNLVSECDILHITLLASCQIWA